MSNERLKYSLLIGGIAAIFFIPFLGGVHLFDWDEVNFAEVSREMLLTKEYTRIYIDFKPFWEKPPLFFWLQAAAMSIFGVGEFAARLPNAICGVFTLIVLFNMGKTLFNNRFAWIWSLVYFGSILPHLYFKSGIIDPWLNLFIFSGVYYFILFHWKKNGYTNIILSKNKWFYLCLSGVFVGLAMLTKGQVALVIVCLTFFVYWVFQRFRFYINILEFIFFLIAAALVTGAWYGVETWKNGPWFMMEFNKYQYRLFSTPDAGHKGFPAYHFIVLLLGCFPAAIFALRSFFKLPTLDFEYQIDFRRWMKILFWVVLILFSIVKSKIVHYSSMCYFPLTFLAALVIYLMQEGRIKMNNWMKAGLIFTGGLFAIAVILLPIVGNNLEWLKPLFNDPFAVASMDAEVNWTIVQALPGVGLFIVIFSAIRWLSISATLKGALILFIGTALFVQFTLFTSINKIEQYSQRAAIDFFKSKVNEDCYVYPMGYKSYGHLFYTQKRPVTNSKSYDFDWRMSDDLDKPLYYVTKVHKAAGILKKYPKLKKIEEKNGFVFLKKE